MLREIQHFVEMLPEPCFLLTASGEILLANAAAAELTGMARKGLAGQPLLALVNDPPEKISDYLKFCARSLQLTPGSLALRLKDGRAMDVRCDGAAIEARAAATGGILFLRLRPKAEATDQFVLLNQKIAALSKEIAERKKAERQRDELLQGEQAARVEAERVSRMKDEFLATLSHELRTPLNAILGWTALLERESLSADAAEGVEVIARNARAQKQLIEDLLDMSRIISGKIRLDVQPVDLASVIDAAAATVRPAADAKARPAPGDAGPTGRADQGRPQSAATGGMEPPEQRREIHAQRGTGAGVSGARQLAS